jgi:FtsP/CotA-like multicopper oxidase with cupredoxin domain
MLRSILITGLLVIATDGIDTEPLLVDSVIVHLGERYDAIIIPKKDEAYQMAEGNYWIRANTLEADEGAQVSLVSTRRNYLCISWCSSQA